MNIQKQKSSDGKQIVLVLPEKFDYELHKVFKDAYEDVNEEVMVLDMGNTKFMDSSALGMLLQLKEYSEKYNKEIIIKKVSDSVLNILQIAHFDKLFKLA